MNWALFLSIYILIFLAELPDKTAFATLLLAARSRASAVFIGVAAAFLVQTIVATVFGGFIALLPEKWVHLGAGLLFLGFAVHMWRARNEIETETGGDLQNGAVGFWRGAWQAFIVIFIAEWGDLTQIATASLIAKYANEKLTVFTAAVCALWSVTALAVFIGHRMKNWIRPSLLKTICAILFFGIGIYFVTSPLVS